MNNSYPDNNSLRVHRIHRPPLLPLLPSSIIQTLQADEVHRTDHRASEHLEIYRVAASHSSPANALLTLPMKVFSQRTILSWYPMVVENGNDEY